MPSSQIKISLCWVEISLWSITGCFFSIQKPRSLLNIIKFDLCKASKDNSNHKIYWPDGKFGWLGAELIGYNQNNPKRYIGLLHVPYNVLNFSIIRSTKFGHKIRDRLYLLLYLTLVFPCYPSVKCELETCHLTMFSFPCKHLFYKRLSSYCMFEKFCPF